MLQGRGVFQNVPATRRQGLEAGAQYQTPQYLVYANYAFVDATYQFTGLLASPNNPSADANGDVLVTPGNQIPGIPRHQVKGGVDYFVTPALKLGTDVIWVGSQWYVGDDANQNVKLADYLGREPARLLSAHQRGADLRGHQQSVQPEVRDFRHLFRSGVDRQRAPESADRPPHHHAGTAAVYLCRDARKVVIEPYLPTAGETSTPRVPWRREASALREGPVTNSGWWDAASAFAEAHGRSPALRG